MIEHKPEQQCFILLQDGKECVLAYQLNGQQIDFTRTYVPFALRGKGLAEELVRTGLAWANEQNFTITASCWYVAKFLPATSD